MNSRYWQALKSIVAAVVVAPPVTVKGPPPLFVFTRTSEGVQLGVEGELGTNACPSSVYATGEVVSCE
jgi:hypothetical protein